MRFVTLTSAWRGAMANDADHDMAAKLKAKLARAGGGALRLSSVFAIQQTAYGIKPYSGAGGLARVADELEVLAELSLGPGK